MDSITETIIEAAGKAIFSYGIRNFTIESLAGRPEIKGTGLPPHIQQKEDVFVLLLIKFEYELHKMVDSIRGQALSPALEIESLFRNLSGMFREKPYYLAIIFDSELKEQNKKTKEIIARIKGRAENYLTALIDRGKKEKAFLTAENTKTLTNHILNSFRFLMNDLLLYAELSKNLKMLKPYKN
ncbi:MAG TPA: hypothetical protein PLI30_07245 [Petrimonas sp.]|nr:hypothetical protein [Petrimonas sp.]